MDFFSLAHSRRHFGAHLHLQLLFLEPSQWFCASGMMCNIFVDTCVRHSEVSADCRFPTSSSAPSKPAERRSLHCSESVPPVVPACRSVVLELSSHPSQLLGCSQKHLALPGRSRCPSGAALLLVWNYRLQGLSMSSASRNREFLVSLRP